MGNVPPLERDQGHGTNRGYVRSMNVYIKWVISCRKEKIEVPLEDTTFSLKLYGATFCSLINRSVPGPLLSQREVREALLGYRRWGALNRVHGVGNHRGRDDT